MLGKIWRAMGGRHEHPADTGVIAPHPEAMAPAPAPTAPIHETPVHQTPPTAVNDPDMHPLGVAAHGLASHSVQTASKPPVPHMPTGFSAPAPAQTAPAVISPPNPEANRVIHDVRPPRPQTITPGLAATGHAFGSSPSAPIGPPSVHQSPLNPGDTRITTHGGYTPPTPENHQQIDAGVATIQHNGHGGVTAPEAKPATNVFVTEAPTEMAGFSADPTAHHHAI